MTIPDSARRRPLRLLTVAELHWRNGHEFALQAVERLRRQGLPFEYRIVGQGPFLEAVAFARYELKLMDVVHLVSVTDSTVDQELAWADLFLLAAVADGAEHTLTAALASKVPVVCTDVPTLARQIQEGVNGFVVPRRNPEAMASCLAAQFGRERLA
jgi:colanic acid/amylovoran biosynthesis glycosyltransferase